MDEVWKDTVRKDQRVRRLNGNLKLLRMGENGTVKALMTRDEFYARQSESYVERSFQGSLPGFLTAFTSRRKLSPEEIGKLKQIIEENR